MSNLDYSEKHAYLAQRSTKKKLQLTVNVVLITAAFLFVSAAILGIFP